MVIEIFVNRREEGLHVSFDQNTGARYKEFYLKGDKKDELYWEYNSENEELVYETTYQYGCFHGKERRLVVDKRLEVGNCMILMENWKRNGTKPNIRIFLILYLKSIRI